MENSDFINLLICPCGAGSELEYTLSLITRFIALCDILNFRILLVGLQSVGKQGHDNTCQAKSG